LTLMLPVPFMREQKKYIKFGNFNERFDYGN